jgi:hypothetical protein
MAAYYCFIRDKIVYGVTDAVRTVLPVDVLRHKAAEIRGLWTRLVEYRPGEFVTPFLVTSVVFAAHYYSSAKGFSALLFEGASSSLPDGSPSGATVVDARDLTCEVAFEWWYPSVVLERVAQLAACKFSSGGRARVGGDAPDQRAPRALPPRLGALLGRAIRRVERKRSAGANAGQGLVFVFSHGGDGDVIAADPTGSALLEKDRLQARRGSARGRRPSVLAAYMDGSCVTDCIGRIAVLPAPDSRFGTIAPGRALLAYLAARGIDRKSLVSARVATVAPRGGVPPVEYALHGD